MFNLNGKRTMKQKVKGLFKTPIPYEVRVPSGDWSPYFGKYQNQRWGEWDSDSCWALSAVNSLEDQLEWLWKNNMFSPEAKTFFTSNGYIDGDGDFSISERHIEIVTGLRDKGGNSENAWDSMFVYGCIPRSMLTYSLIEAGKWNNKADFENDYFNPSAVTPEMKDLGKKFRQYVNIAHQTIGKNWSTPTKDVLLAALKQAPICIGIPVPVPNVLWNTPVVTYQGNKTTDHEVEMYHINDDGTYAVFDQYLPNLKKLSGDYYLPLCTQGIAYALNPVSVNPVVQDSWLDAFWSGVMHIFNGIFDSTVPIG